MTGVLRNTLMVILVVAAALPADDVQPVDRARQGLTPRTIRLEREGIALQDALTIIQEQTGNVVEDRRVNRMNPRVALKLRDVGFWPGLDEVMRQAGCSYSVYQDDGRLALVDAPPRKSTVGYNGLFRVAVKRVAVVRDEDSGSHFCMVALELAWEPRFQPFLLHVGAIEGVFTDGGPVAAPRMAKAEPQGQQNVTGRSAVEIDVRLPAPPRAYTRLASLRGEFSLLGPSKMLTFEFGNLKPGQASRETKDEVQVSVTPLTPQRKRWSFDVAISNPPGGPKLESYQEDLWLGNNQIALLKTEGAKTQRITPLASDREDLELTGRRAHIRYHFTRDLPPSASGWSLTYRTPGRIVDVPGSFLLNDIPLP